MCICRHLSPRLVFSIPRTSIYLSAHSPKSGSEMTHVRGPVRGPYSGGWAIRGAAAPYRAPQAEEAVPSNAIHLIDFSWISLSYSWSCDDGCVNSVRGNLEFPLAVAPALNPHAVINMNIVHSSGARTHFQGGFKSRQDGTSAWSSHAKV